MLHHFITHVGLLHGQETEVGVFFNGVVRKKSQKIQSKKDESCKNTVLKSDPPALRAWDDKFWIILFARAAHVVDSETGRGRNSDLKKKTLRVRLIGWK